MPTIQQKIAEKFLAKLSESKAVDATKIDWLRVVLADTKIPKPDDFVRIFTQPGDGETK
jgi:hypothetical protein